MALRGGNALNKGSARSSAKFLKPKKKAPKKAKSYAKGSLGKPAGKMAQTKAKAGTMRMSAKHPRNKR